MNQEEFRFAYWVARQGGIDAAYTPDSLEAKKEETGEELGEDDPDEAQAQWLTIMRWIHETGADVWIEKLLGPEADADTLTWLVDQLDGDASKEHPNSDGDGKVKAFRVYAGISRFCKAAEEYGSVEISGPLRVMRLRRAAAAGEIPRSEVTKRKLAEKLGVSDKTITAWDERAEKLGVTFEDWDYERLRLIVKPPRRAPP